MLRPCAWRRAGQDAGDDRRALEQGAPGQVGRGHAGGGFVAAAHGHSPNSKLMSTIAACNAAVFLFCPQRERICHRRAIFSMFHLPTGVPCDHLAHVRPLAAAAQARTLSQRRLNGATRTALRQRPGRGVEPGLGRRIDQRRQRRAHARVIGVEPADFARRSAGRAATSRRSIGASVSVSNALSGFSAPATAGPSTTSTRFSMRMP